MDKYWNKERLEAHAAPHLEFNPEKKPWVGLTDEEATALWEGTDDRDSWELIKQVEKTLKWKNT